MDECFSKMITGTVNGRREAVISIEVHGVRSQRLVMDAVIDTRFDGFLVLPSSSIAVLGLRRLGSKTAELGDGSICRLAVYSVRVMWDGAMRDGEVSAAEIEPLVGMELLAGYEVRIQVAEGGDVTIEAMP
jgi:clan AA aspartic protease